jgi:hypothetical protein
MSAPFTARIIKGGALLADSRRFLEAWEPDRTPKDNITRFSARHTLGKTQVRQRAVLEILRRRFLDPGPEVVSTLRHLVGDPAAFREACYYEATRTDGLLAAFTEDPLFTWYQGRRKEISVDEVSRWLATDSRVPRWNAETRARVAQGVIATLRDFGILEGAMRGRRKRIATPHLSVRGFGYVALRERSGSASDRSIVDSPVWRRYLLTPEAVRRMFLEADRLGFLRFAEAGSMVRIDWLVRKLTEMPNVLPV